MKPAKKQSRKSPRKAFSIAATRTPQEVFAAFDTWASTRDDAFAIWSILSALRGPDNSKSDTLKWDTTAKVRARVLPKLADQGAIINAAPLETDLVNLRSFLNEQEADEHFRAHIMDAFYALRQLNFIPGDE